MAAGWGCEIFRAGSEEVNTGWGFMGSAEVYRFIWDILIINAALTRCCGRGSCRRQSACKYKNQ